MLEDSVQLPPSPFDRSEDRAPVQTSLPGKPISDLKGKHAGSCAIFFNGSSLHQHDLWQVRLPIIGMNRTHAGWPSYRGPQPDYLCLVDSAWFYKPDWWAGVSQHPCVINGSIEKAGIGYRVVRHPRMSPFSFDLARDGYVAPIPCTTGHLALQLAVYLGFTKLFCLGWDLGGRHFDDTSASPHFKDAIRYHKTQAKVLAERGILVYVCGSPQSNAPFLHVPFSVVCEEVAA